MESDLTPTYGKYMRTHTNGENRIYLIGQTRTGNSDLEFENATYTSFNQPKSIVAKLFKLKTYGDTIRLTDLSQPQVREIANRS